MLQEDSFYYLKRACLLVDVFTEKNHKIIMGNAMLLRKTRFRYALLLLLSLPLLFANCGDSVENLTDEQKAKVKEVVNNTELQSGITVEDLAYHWAPIHYQALKECNGDRSRVDYITRVDRDLPDKEGGNWNLDINHDQGLNFPVNAYTYYSVVSTKTHYYITYTFFHPFDTMIINDFDVELNKDRTRDFDWTWDNGYYQKVRKVVGNIPLIGDILDWVDEWVSVMVTEFAKLPYPKITVNKRRVGEFKLLSTFFMSNDYIQNDFEGVMFIIKKDSGYGTLETVAAQAHGYFWTYFPDETIRDRFNSKSERTRPIKITMVQDEQAQASMGDTIPRVITTQEAGSHGAGCYPDWGAPSPGDLRYPVSAFRPHKSGDKYIRYIPTRTGNAEEPKSDELYINGNEFTYCKYKLINMFDPDGGLWANKERSGIFDKYNKDDLVYKLKGGDNHGDVPWLWGGHKTGIDNPIEFVKSELEKVLVGKYITKIKDNLWTWWLANRLNDIESFGLTNILDLLNAIESIPFIDDYISSFYSPLYLSLGEEKMIDKAQHPWSHNPVYFSWVYLQTKNCDVKDYFSNEYVWNNYAENNLNSSFTFNVDKPFVETIAQAEDTTNVRNYLQKSRAPAYICPCKIPGINMKCNNPEHSE